MLNPLFLRSDPVFLWKSYRWRRVLEARETFWSTPVFSKAPCPFLAIQTCICCLEKLFCPQKKSQLCWTWQEEVPLQAQLRSTVLGFFGPSPNPSLIIATLPPCPIHLPPLPSLISLGLASKSWEGKADSDTSWDCAADITGKSSLGSCRTRSYCQSIWLRVATNMLAVVLVQQCSPEVQRKCLHAIMAPVLVAQTSLPTSTEGEYPSPVLWVLPRLA